MSGIVLPLAFALAMLVCSCVNGNNASQPETLFVEERYHGGGYDVEGRLYPIDRLLEMIGSRKIKRIHLLEDKVSDEKNNNNARLIRYCRDNNIHVDVDYATSLAVQPDFAPAVFERKLQKLSGGMSPETVRKLLGEPDKTRTIGQVGFARSNLPDSFTFFDYEPIGRNQTGRHYRVTIMFSREKKRIVSVHRETDIPGYEEMPLPVVDETGLLSFCTFLDCRKDIDVLSRDFARPWERDTPERIRLVIEELAKRNVRKKSLDALSAAGLTQDRIGDLLVVEWMTEILPYRALYCGDKLYFVFEEGSGKISVRQFEKDAGKNRAAQLRELIANCRSRGDISCPARDSMFWFFTDLRNGKIVAIHGSAITARRRDPASRSSESELAPLYDTAQALMKELDIKLWK